ncbi:hypothetical protein NDU88_009499 [Pleurodeles waltl]|uniref:Uncharacterized protein n=1 Tax=Pleurodeles waltl TaxID=8319 RepID=A0AAV7RYK5_PLEWA|nr:hypothetical protein NDU88_009499 [Pleurodeles waltl]
MRAAAVAGGGEEPKGAVSSGQNYPGQREDAPGHQSLRVDHCCAASAQPSRPGGLTVAGAQSELGLAYSVGREHHNRWAPAGGAPADLGMVVPTWRGLLE